MIILYDNPDKAIKAYKMLKEGFFDEKQLTVLLLPSIQVVIRQYEEVNLNKKCHYVPF